MHYWNPWLQIQLLTAILPEIIMCVLVLFVQQCSGDPTPKLVGLLQILSDRIEIFSMAQDAAVNIGLDKDKAHSLPTNIFSPA